VELYSSPATPQLYLLELHMVEHILMVQWDEIQLFYKDNVIITDLKTLPHE
jgi:hypothetical protein